MDRKCGWMVSAGAVLALSGCGQPSGDPELLARVGEVRIITDDLRRLVDRQAAENEETANAEIDYREQLQTLVDREVLLLEARARGLQADSLVVARVETHEEEALVREMLHLQVTARLRVTPEEIAREYELGGWGEETKTLEIFVTREATARVVGDSLAAGSDFAALGRRYSEDHMFKVPVGAPEVHAYAPKDAPRRVAEAVSSLPIGQIAGPIAVSDGFVYAQVLERRKVPQDEVEKKVVEWLTRAKQEALRNVYYISLQKSSGLELNQEGMDLLIRSLEAGRAVEALTADERQQAVYTYDGGQLAVAQALPRALRAARRWARIEETLVVEDLRKELRRRLVVQDARAQGHDRAEVFRQWVAGRREDLMISRLRSLVLEDLTITEEDLAARYEEIREVLNKPGVARVQDVLVEKPELARSLRQEIEAGADMGALAGRHSIRENPGDGVIQVQDVETRQYGEEWLKAVMSAPLNVLQGPVVAKGGYSLFLVLEREEAGFYSMENPHVRKTLNRDVKQAKERALFNELVERLQQKYADRIEVFEDHLEQWVGQREGS